MIQPDELTVKFTCPNCKTTHTLPFTNSNIDIDEHILSDNISVVNLEITTVIIDIECPNCNKYLEIKLV